MFDFSTITELRLASGNHKSPDEGLCFLELAAYFAGEAHSDHPACVCPVLGAYGIRLNDRMPDDVRDRLLKPLVPLIVGTRDKASERKRAEFLAMWTTNKVLPIPLRAHGFDDHALACERAPSLSEAKIAADAAANAYAAADARAAAYAFAACNASAYAAAYAAYTASVATPAADAAAALAKAAPKAADAIWIVAVEGLTRAILIGKHEGFAEPESVIVERREKLRELVS